MSECVCECSVICVMCLSGLRGVCGVSKCCGGVIEWCGDVCAVIECCGESIYHYMNIL